MLRKGLFGLLCAVFLASAIHSGSARGWTPPPPYNPYPPGILPFDIDSEIARVQREITGIVGEGVGKALQEAG